MGERAGSGGGAAAPALAFCLGAPRPARSALLLPLLLLSCWAPRELLVRTRSPSRGGNRSLALSPKLRGAPRRPRSTLSGGRKRPSGSAPEPRGAGERGRREKGGLVRAPAGSTHTPFLLPGAGQADAAEFSGTGAWASTPAPGARGAGASTGGQAGGQGRRGRRPRGGGAPLCPLALGGDGAVCTPLRRSRSSADGWDLKFFLPLWKSGRERGGAVAMAMAPLPPLLLAGAPTTLVLFYCHVMAPSLHTHAHLPLHLPAPFSCNPVFPFAAVGSVLASNFWARDCHSAGCSGWREVGGPPHLAVVAFLSEWDVCVEMFSSRLV